MQYYLDIVNDVIENGVWKDNRTGVKTKSLVGMRFFHDMRKGFPLLTTKKMSYKNIFVELEFFIKGLRDKRWLHERGCHIWDEWCNPKVLQRELDDEIRKRDGSISIEETQKKMKEINDLGVVYGVQWRNFGATDREPNFKGTDQLKEAIKLLKTDPRNRRIIVSAWNPNVLDEQALPPCHCFYQFLTDERGLHLIWYQRSVDVGLGLPYNIASYACLLSLVSQEVKIEPATLTGFLGDVHVYENHIEPLKEQLKRTPYELGTLRTDNFKSIFDWEYKDSVVENYKSHPAIKMEIAV